LGAFKSKGFGVCEIEEKGVQPYEAKFIDREGTLVSRLYADDDFLAKFGIRDIHEVIKPHFGYLFRKDSMETGYYQKSIFEGSRIRHGFDFLMEEYYEKAQEKSSR
jgi:hypothetical protein